ncbi:hypothetical protein GCM10022291_24630 [Postechiella marina]|uniref:Helix-turn-helix domain-containing protein n=1 Tax=Postechiella marina TaxID=943941 RepID=A0ABP8CCD8_9FLAO
MTEKQNIEASLEQVCNDKLFAKSTTYSRLLKYLVKKALLSEDVNENIIGTELFGIDYTKDKNNGVVRSYMYKLRKKLKEYYLDSNQEHKIVFFLKKGHYNLSFISVSDYHSIIKSRTETISISKKKLKVLVGTILFLTFLFVIINLVISKPHAIWKPFFSNSTLVVISDQFMLSETDSLGVRRGTMYKEINSNKDFIEYTNKHPNKNITLTDYTLMSKMAPYGIKLLSEWFVLNKGDYTLKLESKLTFDDVQNHNILFIGQYKTMNLSSLLFLKDSKVFTTYRDGFKYVSNNSSKAYNTKFGAGLKVEYAMVSSTSLSPGKRALYFVSNNDIGVIATVKNFTNIEWLNNFLEQIPNNAQSFNALFEVSGLQRTEVSCKLVELEVFND